MICGLIVIVIIFIKGVFNWIGWDRFSVLEWGIGFPQFFSSVVFGLVLFSDFVFFPSFYPGDYAIWDGVDNDGEGNGPYDGEEYTPLGFLFNTFCFWFIWA